MGINAVSLASTSKTSPTATDAAARMPGKNLNQDDFLKLLVSQFSAQDPMNPQKDTEFIAQMAQFSSLEQTRAMQSDIAGMRNEQQIQQANALIGRSVIIEGASGTPVTGIVSGVTLANGTPQIVVNGEPCALSRLLGVTTTPALS
jgi:flagellar basal-body rod modification protein FlgD